MVACKSLVPTAILAINLDGGMPALAGVQSQLKQDSLASKEASLMLNMDTVTGKQ